MTDLRIVAISDTHGTQDQFICEQILQLRPNVLLHIGDIADQGTLSKYQSLVSDFRPVRGDHDDLCMDARLIHTFGRVRVGQIHGERPSWKERPSNWINKLLRGNYYFWNGFAEDALSAIGEKVDVLLTGHLHVPFIRKIDTTFVINPGAIAVNGRSHHLLVPTLAVIDISEAHVSARILAIVPGRTPIPVPVSDNGPIKGWFARKQKNRTMPTPKQLEGSRLNQFRSPLSETNTFRCCTECIESNLLTTLRK